MKRLTGENRPKFPKELINETQEWGPVVRSRLLTRGSEANKTQRTLFP